MAYQNHLHAFRDLIAAAEAAGWDQEQPEVLERARDAHAALCGTESDVAAAVLAGWKKDGLDGCWSRPGTDQDPLTIHDKFGETERGYVLATSAAEAICIDREVFGDAA